MKTFLVTVILAVAVLAADAQKPLNSVKADVSNLIYGDYSLSFERQMYRNSSLSIRMGYLQPFNHLFNKYNIDLSGDKTGFDTSLEYRFFVARKNKTMLSGFYAAPYLRFASLNLNFIDEIQITPFSVSLTYSNIGAGLQLGVQKYLSAKSGSFLNHIVYDFHFLGGGFDRHNLTLAYQELKNPDDYDYKQIEDDIRSYFEKVPFLTRSLKFNYLNSLLSVDLPFYLPGLRAGFSIGYSF